VCGGGDDDDVGVVGETLAVLLLRLLQHGLQVPQAGSST